MKGHKTIDRLGALAIVLALCAAIAMMAVPQAGADTPQATTAMGYEDKLFDTSRVHTIDIRIDDWEGFIATCQSEEYSLCSVVIDGETVHNVGIRGKGNTSLSNVASMDSDRYSFKIEFDQYDDSISYHGLDKLSLNNLIQDNTMMKDYLTYRMMNEFGAAAPLCSFAYLTVNGEDWGLYLAVEAVEDSFLTRNFGSDYGDLYKPDSLQMGGGKGNGRDFDMDNFLENAEKNADFAQKPGNFERGDRGGFGGGGMGSSEGKLQYIDDDLSSYSTIFDSAKTVSTEADQKRLVQALKTLSSDNATDAVDIERLLRYFVVHNYVVNGDSYTGSMVHNYYLYEEDGKLSMIPWDYNLAFGSFQSNDATNAVNDDIDAPLSVTGSDRPMIDWIFNDAEATAQYHALFAEFLNTVDADALIAQAQALITPYVEKDPTKFCTYEEFETAVDALRTFCQLRTLSVKQQLTGEAGSIDASSLNLNDMGSMGRGGMGDKGNMGGFDRPQGDMQMPEGMQPQGGMQVPDDMQMPEGMQPQGDMAMPEGMQPPDGMTMPEGMQPPEDMQSMPQGGMNRPGRQQNGGMPTGRGEQPFAQPDGFAQEQRSSSTSLPVILLTAAVLAGGLLFAMTYKRRR